MHKAKSRMILVIVLVLLLTLISDKAVSAKTVRKDGYYYTMAQKAVNGVYGSDLYIKKVKIKGNKITTYGNFTYGKNEWGGKKIKTQKRTFIVSGKCSYWDDWGVPDGKKRIKKKRFIKTLKSCSSFADTGECFIIQVKNGKVRKMMLGQG